MDDKSVDRILADMKKAPGSKRVISCASKTVPLGMLELSEN